MMHETSENPYDPPPVEASLADDVVATPTVIFDAERRLRTFWRFAIFGLGFLIVQVIVSIVAGIVLVIYIVASGNGSLLTDPQAAQRTESLISHAYLLAVATPPTTVLVFLLAAICRKYLDRRTVASMGLKMRSVGSVPLGVLAGVAPILAIAVIVMGLGGFQWGGISFSVQAGVMIPTFIIAAFMEEIMFRGYLLQNMVDVRRPIWGIVFTSVIFWLIHAANPHVWSSPLISVNMIGAGVILAQAYLLSGDIWFPTALHFGWNFAQGVLLSLPVSGIEIEGIVSTEILDGGNTLLTGGEFGLEASAVTAGVELLVIAAFAGLMIAKRSRDSFPEKELA